MCYKSLYSAISLVGCPREAPVRVFLGGVSGDGTDLIHTQDVVA